MLEWKGRLEAKDIVKIESTYFLIKCDGRKREGNVKNGDPFWDSQGWQYGDAHGTLQTMCLVCKGGPFSSSLFHLGLKA